MKYRYIPSPIGNLLIGGRSTALELIGFPGGKGVIHPEENWVEDQNLFNKVEDQINEYFEGRRKKFSLSLSPSGTPFQLSVLDALLEVPYGQTVTYLDIARAVGRPKAVRAVGAANGRNPLPIVIPCHRVIGADGSLTGFGGGLEAKSFLLNHESDGFSLTSG